LLSFYSNFAHGGQADNQTDISISSHDIFMITKVSVTLSTISFKNGMVQALIWNIPYMSIGVKGLIYYTNDNCSI